MTCPRALRVTSLALALVMGAGAWGGRACAQAVGNRMRQGGIPEGVTPPQLVNVGIDEKPGALIPRDVRFRDQEGKAVTLADYLDGKPTVLVLAYYECPMLCTMVLNGLTHGLKQLAWAPGERYHVVTVSIDPTDTPDKAKAKRASHLGLLGKGDPGPKGWDFLVGDEANIKRLADAVGFRYRYEEDTKQYAHAAGAFVVTPDGRLSRTLFGISFPERSLRMAINEASDGQVGSAWDKVMLFCFHYDPKVGAYVASAKRLMQLGGIVTVIALSVFLRRLWRTSERVGAGGAQPINQKERVV